VNLIEVDNVSFAYTEGIPVLKNVTFSLNSGSVAIIGQNGSGKTTLVKLLKHCSSQIPVISLLRALIRKKPQLQNWLKLSG